MLKIRFTPIDLEFKFPAGTSRGILTSKPSWILELWDDRHPEKIGMGECSVIPGLSPDYQSREAYELLLYQLSKDPDMDLSNIPSIRFGMEAAQLNLKQGTDVYFENDFSKGIRSIPINGLIWMDTKEKMQAQIDQKIAEGFTTIKLKIGAINIAEELDLLRHIRENYSEKDLTIRVDANGAFTSKQVPKILSALHRLKVHSIEQPIKAGQWDPMKKICRETPIPIALDEELIGINSTNAKILLLERIRPQYIILKPSLHGGISGTKEWIKLAEERKIKWWITSALESNIGLNAICQLAAEYQNDLPQGLGTGGLYTNNIDSKLQVKNGSISLNRE